MTLLDDIKERVDIVEVVEDYLPLQKSGRNFKATCPFHNERTPSFYVFPERQTWRCFGACASGGDVITFVQRRESLDFTQTLHLLARRANIPIPERRPRQQQEVEDPLLHANRIAAEFYHQVLYQPMGQEALAYLRGRGLDLQTIDHFQLGLQFRRRGVAAAPCRPGYVLERRLNRRPPSDHRGRPLRDMFHQRVMFPIHDAQGRIIGFGGRALGDAQPKYLNTPQTPLFDKGGTLYALHLATPAIRQSRVGVIVEGYMDVIAAHQHGFTNVIASMGTALTEAQVARLRGLGDTFVLALDPDAAGQEATLRSLETSWHALERRPALTTRRGVTLFQRPQGPELKVAVLPADQDPDQLIRTQPQAWEHLIQEAQPWWEYLFQAEAARHDLSSPQGQGQVAERLFPLIAALNDPYQQERLFTRLAEILGVSRATLEASVGRPRPQSRSRPQRQASPASTPQAAASAFHTAQSDPLEDYTLALLLQHPELRHRSGSLSAHHFRRPQNRELFTSWIQCSTLEVLRVQLPDLLHDHLDQLLQYPLLESDSAQCSQGLEQAGRRLEERHLRDLKLEEELVLGQQWAEGPLSEEVVDQQDLKTTESLRQVFLGRRAEPS